MSSMLISYASLHSRSRWITKGAYTCLSCASSRICVPWPAPVGPMPLQKSCSATSSGAKFCLHTAAYPRYEDCIVSRDP